MKFPSSAGTGTSATRDRGAAYGSVAMAVPPFFLAEVGEAQGRGALSALQGHRSRGRSASGESGWGPGSANGAPLEPPGHTRVPVDPGMPAGGTRHVAAHET